MKDPVDRSYLHTLSIACDQLGRCRDPSEAIVIAERIAEALAQGRHDEWPFALEFANQALAFGVDDLGAPPHLELLAERCNAHECLRADGLVLEVLYGRLSPIELLAEDSNDAG